MWGIRGEAFPYDGPPDLLPDLLAALERVVDPEVGLNIVDPEVGLNIVDVGLVYGVRVDEGRMDVDITMTSAACPVIDVIVEDVERQLDRAMPPGLLIHVEVVWDPPWTPERMSARARAAMGW